MSKITLSLVQTVTVGSGGAASIDFTSIPQTGTDLLVVFSGRTSDTAANALVKFNGSTANLTARRLYGYNPESFGVGSDTAFTIGDIGGTSTTANTFSNGQVYIPNYAGSTNKSFSVDEVYENNGNAGKFIVAGLWSNTAAITSLSLYLSGGNWVQYSTASLYTITKGSGGATVA